VGIAGLNRELNPGAGGGRLKTGSALIRTIAILALTTLILSTAVTTAHSGTCWHTRRSERKMVRKMNGARNRHGLPPIQFDRHLSKVSRVHTNAMVNRRTLFHTSPSVLTWRVTRWNSLGENVGRTPRGVRSLHRSMMNSAGHRANVLNSAFTYVGIGAVKKRGSLWMTVTFESRRNPGTRLSMPSC
jgi:uncharacterized protein YkwD